VAGENEEAQTMDPVEHASGLSTITESIHIAGEISGMFGVAIMVVGIGIATIIFFVEISQKKGFAISIHEYKIRIGRAMLLSLEVLIAADIVETVALAPTIQNMMALGVIVIVRTFLSWALTLEIEGHWPWQSSGSHGAPKTTN